MTALRIFTICILAAFCASASAQQTLQRIYTVPDPSASGGIIGKINDAELTHAMAVDHERVKVFGGALEDGGRAFRFSNLPVGKYDVVLVTKSGMILEGISLGDGDAAKLPPMSGKNLRTRIDVSEKFFNRCFVHRLGTDGERAFAFVERIRDQPILKQSGEKLDANLRRLEIIELAPATDDWQMVSTRLLYREPESPGGHPAFSKHAFVPALGNVRVVGSVKTLDPVSLPNP